jgi:ubiquinone/menaquinone biosynthesis C-methylase UbiE
LPLEKARDYFEYLASLGLTKHFGSMEATRRLIELCHIGRGDLVLDVGTGVGATPSYLARELGCRVVGVDLLERMIEQSRDRASMDGVAGPVAFAVADARALPFRDGLFDAVIMESLNVFFEDKQRAMREYVRVTRPGGYVGITEMTWLGPPSPETAAYYKRVVFADSLEASGWIELLEEAGLEDVVGGAHPVDIPKEAKGRFERYGGRGFMKVLVRALVTALSDPASRAFLKDVTRSLPQDMLKDMGYGVFAGRKAE